MITTENRIREFWQWFEDHLPDFMALSKADEPFWDVAVKQIKKVDQRFWIELSDAGDVPRELIVTAEGHVDAFPVAEQLINLAPTIEGWIFLALKPPMGFNFTTVYEGTFFDPRAMWFLPLERDQLEADFALRIGVPGLNAMDERVALNAVLVILDTGLGERSAALDIQKILLAELVANPESQGYIELVELPDYIRWRKNKLEPSKNRV